MATPELEPTLSAVRSVPMPVVDIADVGMGVLRFFMAVFMGMLVRTIGASSLQLLKRVIVSVMGVSLNWVVAMTVV